MTLALGTQTASLSNYLLSGTKGQPTPEVGMGITILMWTDRQPATITRISKSGKVFWFKRDHAERRDANGMSESQTYDFLPNPAATEQRATLRKTGAWKCQGHQIRLGSRDKYHDYSF